MKYHAEIEIVSDREGFNLIGIYTERLIRSAGVQTGLNAQELWMKKQEEKGKKEGKNRYRVDTLKSDDAAS